MTSTICPIFTIDLTGLLHSYLKGFEFKMHPVHREGASGGGGGLQLCDLNKMKQNVNLQLTSSHLF